MSSSSTISLKTPKTPSAPRWSSSLFNCKPIHPSPLASSSPERGSPCLQAQSRRRQQFKTMHAHDVSTPKVRRQLFVAGAHPHMQSPTSDDSPQKAFLRKRFKEKCIERAQRARERSLKIKRWGSEQSSDGFDMDTDMDVDGGDDDDDEFGLDDEIFRRIIANENRRREHAYRLSYELDVGSSIDPNMEDVAALEEELLTASKNTPSSSQINAPAPNTESIDEIPDEWDEDDDELAAMYDEYLQEQEKEQQRLQETNCGNTDSSFITQESLSSTMDDVMES